MDNPRPLMRYISPFTFLYPPIVCLFNHSVPLDSRVNLIEDSLHICNR